MALRLFVIERGRRAWPQDFLQVMNIWKRRRDGDAVSIFGVGVHGNAVVGCRYFAITSHHQPTRLHRANTLFEVEHARETNARLEREHIADINLTEKIVTSERFVFHSRNQAFNSGARSLMPAGCR